ncbi:MAG: response regulator [Gammaproteobacteria bacterium]|nr:response regulator [Gammaproteobacteria bacterium]MDH5730933.1 response regulator [Gammaproteobacteria bacterium]
MRLLIVEDDMLLGDGIQAGLTQEGYAVDWVEDGDAADTALMTNEYELMVLDIGLPKRSGLEVLKKLRAEGNDLPVIILTARDTVDDRVKGLDTGADDYLTKPFDLGELSARIRALLRRRGGRTSPVISHIDLVVDPASHTVNKSGTTIDISPREFTILQLLLENRGKVMSRSRLEEGLYAWNDEVESNTVEVHIHHLRKKLGSELIRTIRGVGYIVDKPKE